MSNNVWPKIKDIAGSVNSGKVSAVSNVKKSLEQIEQSSEYQAIISVVEDRALQRAAEIDAMVASGQNAGRLAGVPFIAKDNFLTFGSETTAASNILKGFNAPYQSTAIEKLEAEGAICVAKANLDAFAHGGSTENSDFFVTKNPHDVTKVPGGSSGGSAASVVLGMAPFALGTDTGGSIRLPASFCGAVGYKPTYGLVSRFGVVAMASSTDTIGPLTNNVDDAALVVDCMSGVDRRDGTTIAKDILGYEITGQATLPKLKIGIIKEYMGDGLDLDVRSAINSAVEKLKSLGYEITEVSLPSLPLALASYYVIVPAEISSNLARYDGQRFGYSVGDAKNLEESYNQSRSQGFGAEAKRRIMIGTYVLSSGYYDAYYKKAQTLRTQLINEFTDAFKNVDFLVGPVAPETAFKIGENSDDPLKMYLVDIMTVAVSLAGLPSISVPITVTGMPVGLQIIGAQKSDKKLLQMAKSAEGII